MSDYRDRHAPDAPRVIIASPRAILIAYALAVVFLASGFLVAVAIGKAG